jgi:hypothetical protein
MRILSLAIILLMGMSMSSNVQEKRVAPAKIKPILNNGSLIEVQYEPNSSGYSAFIVSKKASDDTVTWKTQIYSKVFDKNMETDVQEIYLRSLLLEKNRIIAVDEHQQKYEVDFGSGKLLKPLLAVVYSKDN